MLIFLILLPFLIAMILFSLSAYYYGKSFYLKTKYDIKEYQEFKRDLDVQLNRQTTVRN